MGHSRRVVSLGRKIAGVWLFKRSRMGTGTLDIEFWNCKIISGACRYQIDGSW